MLVAPAGYGKTTLARQWLSTPTRPAAWFVATPSSVDVAALAVGLHRALSIAHPGVGSLLLERLPVTVNPQSEAEALADVLAEDLGPLPDDQWLVIDDYQEMTGTAAPERFIEILLLSRPINLLLLTRERPSWASARRILYGEIAEFGRDELVMSHDEAAALLAREDGNQSGLLDATGGWPAALALAAISPASPHGLTMETGLYRFFADELYERIDDQTRRGLWEIALLAPKRRDVIAELLGAEEARRTIDVGYQHGFLTETDLDGIEVHPLLRRFLDEKLRQEPIESLELLVGRTFQYLVTRGLWDEAFALISRFELPTLLPRLLKAALPELLSVGRTETLRRWISRGGAPAADPTIGLTAAELAFREGHYYASETLAEVAAGAPECDPHIETCALIVAGRAAHAASREHKSLAFYVRARETKPAAGLMRVALMGELAAAIELELSEATTLAEKLAASKDLLPQERVVLAGRVLNLQTRYALPVDLDAGRAAQQLLHLVDDPVARCSFRNVLGYGLAACGQYEEALTLTDEQLSDADRCRLEFVLPYAYCVQALSHAGGRYFAQAGEILRKAERLASKAGDRTALVNSRCLQARVLVAQGAFQLVFAQPPQTHGLMNSLASELLASHALARAGAGDVVRALELAGAAEAMSGTSETRICVPAARAVVALYAGDRALALTHANEALQVATATGMIESFVAAYRGCPELLNCLLEDKAAHDALSRVLALSGDRSSASLDMNGSVLALSPREKEVLALLGHGLSNAEIASQLFIGLSTVKVHVRHIFEKLGVKSRTAAALRAVQVGRDHAASPDATNETSR